MTALLNELLVPPRAYHVKVIAAVLFIDRLNLNPTDETDELQVPYITVAF
ncbi:MAG: hypothetical protein NZ988_04875 [Thaumarchaeota archaeon]|nr:hypothetical protein [Candidatus Calditenuaceae archaeon]MDW8187359.1 hypothetical protein [Nitrososphaerota archaeon]